MGPDFGQFSLSGAQPAVGLLDEAGNQLDHAQVITEPDTAPLGEGSDGAASSMRSKVSSPGVDRECPPLHLPLAVFTVRPHDRAHRRGSRPTLVDTGRVACSNKRPKHNPTQTTSTVPVKPDERRRYQE